MISSSTERGGRRGKFFKSSTGKCIKIPKQARFPSKTGGKAGKCRQNQDNGWHARTNKTDAIQNKKEIKRSE
jgi:hypothetical protein